MLLAISYGLLLFWLGVLAYTAVYKSVSKTLLIYSTVFYVARCGLFVANQALHILPPKPSNDMGLCWVEHHVFGQVLAPSADSFMMQGWFITPIYALVSEPIYISLAVNTAFLSIAGYGVGRLASLISTPGKAFMIFLLFNLSPACNNFIMFGVRDPLILFGSGAFFWGLTRYLVGRARWLLNFEVVVGALFMFLPRPELVVIFLPSLVAIDLIIYSRRPRGQFAAQSKFLLYLALGILLVTTSYGSYLVAASNVGQEDADIAVVVGDYGKARYERQFRDGNQSGDESPIIPPNLYEGLPLPFRILIQAAGLIILPFPWTIDSVPKAAAFSDSILHIVILVWLFRARKVQEVRFALIVFFVAVLGLGVIVSNFGNAFRMRIVLLPILMAGLTLAFRKGCSPVVSGRGRRAKFQYPPLASGLVTSTWQRGQAAHLPKHK